MMLLAAIGFVATMVVAGTFQDSLSSGTSKAIDSYFNDQIAHKASPSISVAIVDRGKVVYAKGFGYADLERDVLASPESVYRIGSITKQFTATMIMQLIKEGKLSLDQPFRPILPELPEAWSKVTIRQLLNHTSGIKAYTEVSGLFNDGALKPTTPAGILKTVEKAPLDFPPGTSWHYNNSGYEVLGMLIEKLDGRKYEASLHARILDPLGMSHTYFTSERTLVKNRAQGYDPHEGSWQHAAYLNMDWPYAAGSIESTTLDLAKWDAALYGEKILGQSDLKQMWTPTVLPSGKTEPYGFGWQLDKLNGVDIVQHGGGIHGFITFIRRAPEKALTVIVLTNSGSSNPGAMATDVMGIVNATLKVAEVKTISDKDPATTASAKATLQSILDGKLDRTKLTPEFNKLLTADLEKGAKTELGSLGPINGFEVISESDSATAKIRVYKVTLGSAVLKMTITINAQGLIAGLTLQ
jgi:CubicO group peptidase (beta-lactamase class C family)